MRTDDDTQATSVAAEMLAALKLAEPLLETLHSLLLPGKGEGAKIVWRDLKAVRTVIAKASPQQ